MTGMVLAEDDHAREPFEDHCETTSIMVHDKADRRAHNQGDENQRFDEHARLLRGKLSGHPFPSEHSVPLLPVLSSHYALILIGKNMESIGKLGR